MLKQLMTTTAIVAIAASAHAAGPANQNDNNGAMNPAAIHYAASANIDSSDMLATTLIGQPIYGGVPSPAMMTPNTSAQKQGDKSNQGAVPTDTAGNTPNRIGDINNLIVAKDGSVDAVIIGVGGFLGMGEKNVAVPFDSLKWSVDANGHASAWLDTTKDQLKNAPSFDVSMLQQNANGQNPSATGGRNAPDNQMATNPPAGAAGSGVDTSNPNNGKAAVDATKISANDLNGTTVYDADNQNVGSVGDVIVTKDGKIDAVVVDIGGFLGIGQKPVAIAFEDLNIRKDKDGNLTAYTTFTKDQLDNAPKYDKNAYKTQRDTMRLHTQG